MALIDDLGLASPPFKIRNVEEISEKVGISALPFGFQAVPLTNEAFLSFNDLQWASCPTVREERAKMLEQPDLYSEYSHLVDFLREPASAALGISDELMAEADLWTMFSYADKVIGKTFDGQTLPY